MKHFISPYESRETGIVTKIMGPSSSLPTRTYHLAELDAFRDKLRAGLFKQAMENTAILSNAEEHYLRVAPGGKEEYRLIVRTYAKKAIYEILKGGW